MAGNIRLEVVTPEKAVVSEEVQIVVAPGTVGEFGILKGHTPFMTSLKVGTIRYTDKDGQERAVFTSGGFAEALPDQVTILAESAERRKNINVERAQQAMQRAKKRMDQTENMDYIRASAALERAMRRLRLAGAKKGL